MEVNVITQFTRLASDVDLDPFTTKYCIRRIKSEGIQFLTVTLPKLSKAVLRSLELGFFDRSTLTCFAWKGKSLRVFSKFLNKIFDKTGLVRSDLDPLYIYLLRQVCEYFYKLALPYGQSDIEGATRKFIKTECELAQPVDNDFIEILRKDFEHYLPEVSRAHAKDIFSVCSPRPGSGTFSGNSIGPWYARRVWDDSFSPGLSAFSGYFRYLKKAPVPLESVLDNDYSEVLFVPKDSRGPRTIVREPFSRLKGQLAFFDWLTNLLQKATAGRIQFHDQLYNRRMAEHSSSTRDFATLDLEEASDRVRLDVWLRIARNSPAIKYFLLNVRTANAKLPDNSMVRLRKVAGMGSGLTFPLMSLLIFLVSVRTVSDNLRIPWRKAAKLCMTYGDDLIVPSSCYHQIMLNLTRVGLKVNKEKSYCNSHFRESCGGDYYAGQEVTPVRLKLSHAKVSSRSGLLVLSNKPFGLIELERHCRELVKAGLLQLADYYYSVIERYYGALPLVTRESSVIGRYTLNESDVLSKMQMDEAGNFLPVRVILVKRVSVRNLHKDTYHCLGSSLSRLTRNHWADCIFPEDGSDSSEISVPRKLKITRSRISSFALA